MHKSGHVGKASPAWKPGFHDDRLVMNHVNFSAVWINSAVNSWKFEEQNVPVFTCTYWLSAVMR